jgi:hypothetical protein
MAGKDSRTALERFVDGQTRPAGASDKSRLLTGESGAAPSAIAIGLKPYCPKNAVDGFIDGRIPN